MHQPALEADLSPGIEMLPGPLIHPDLATLSAHAATNEDASPLDVKVALGEGERLTYAQACAPEHNRQRAARNP